MKIKYPLYKDFNFSVFVCLSLIFFSYMGWFYTNFDCRIKFSTIKSAYRQVFYDTLVKFHLFSFFWTTLAVRGESRSDFNWKIEFNECQNTAPLQSTQCNELINLPICFLNLIDQYIGSFIKYDMMRVVEPFLQEALLKCGENPRLGSQFVEVGIFSDSLVS